ncbi:MAG: hypothetical protein ISR96_00910 [Nitrospira sp.]|nr:hypothetical protein [Nitrospira sp.]
MEVSALDSLSSVTQQAAGKSLGREDFMNLLLKQLNSQDPMKPMDSTEFTAQLSQFSSLEELGNINATLDKVLSSQRDTQNAAASDLIGKNVQVEGSSTYLNDTADISYDLSTNAESVKIEVINSAGKHVRSIDAGNQDKGSSVYTWDGKDNFGNRQPEGEYTFEINAEDSDGESVLAATSASGTVKGVVFRDNKTYVVLQGNRDVPFDHIKSIEERS